MNTQDLEKRARELLAAEWERDGFSPVQAQDIRDGYVTNTTATALRAIVAALRQQPAACPKCGGTGEADSGGIMPWGAPAMILCECQQPAAVADDARMAQALEWVWALTKPCSAEEREMLNSIEEAIARCEKVGPG